MTEFIKPPKTLLRQTGRALMDFNMIHEGDRVLLGLSGGKDSLALLHILNHFQRHAPIKFEFAAMTVDPMAGDFDPSPMIPYLKDLGVEYHYRREAIMDMAKEHMGKPSYCAFCSRIKRGIMYNTARVNNFNVIALAQHLDDLAESFMMSAFHGGQLRTMKANYVIDEGDLRVIRPLVYARERQTREFSISAELPVIPDSCPACFSMPTQRQHFKELLAAEEQSNTTLFKSLLTTMKPLMSEGCPDIPDK
ncbi:MAG: tRNA 2-thiocytidine(32) synthetase TtcA [endosymbiont of Galathealinum brachiosum]|uniref:tRNA 2-thiocytidine(32) synthetase TtcA n=1 Tax=endosymbiont of Galathealinum brachiosum TaxID=2200906 RepID=A0A370DF98_9GAMM|nr:MAG: tRNA 2-thiocytidine(32) synthetase TtcA [endosymbiont of Galathealinum brachiosum]